MQFRLVNTKYMRIVQHVSKKFPNSRYNKIEGGSKKCPRSVCIGTTYGRSVYILAKNRNSVHATWANRLSSHIVAAKLWRKVPQISFLLHKLYYRVCMSYILANVFAFVFNYIFVCWLKWNLLTVLVSSPPQAVRNGQYLWF